MGLGDSATNILAQVFYSGGASAETARSVLEKAVGKTRRRLSWRALTGGNDPEYILNIYNAAPRWAPPKL